MIMLNVFVVNNWDEIMWNDLKNYWSVFTFVDPPPKKPEVTGYIRGTVVLYIEKRTYSVFKWHGMFCFKGTDGAIP